MARVKIQSEVTGTVWKVEAALGAALAADDVILVVESMKMEIPVLSHAAGKLVELHVAEGELVEAGQLLAVLER